MKYPTFGAIDKAIESEGLKLIILLRLCPLIPFTILNYLMGGTAISINKYILGSFGMIPGTIVYVFIGTTISSIADAASGNTSGNENNKILILMLIIVGSILACAGIVYVSIVAKKKLKEITDKA